MRMRVHEQEVHRLREVVASVESANEDNGVAFLDLLASLLPANSVSVC